jgi:hypothetical protein
VERLSKALSSTSGREYKKRSSWSMEEETGRSKITSLRFERNHPYLKDLYSFIYEGGKKTFSKKVLNRLTLEGIAIWYMDDGNMYNAKYLTSRGTYRYRIARCTLNTYLSETENQVIIDFFKRKYDIEWIIAKDKGFTRLQMGTKQARKFIDLIKDYIHPSMMYKTEIKVGQELVL